MKRCSYCGAEFSGNEILCPTDQQPLIDPSAPASAATAQPAPDQALRKVHPGGAALIFLGAMQFVLPTTSTSASPEIANALLLKNIGIAILLIGWGLYLQFRKPKTKR